MKTFYTGDILPLLLYSLQNRCDFSLQQLQVKIDQMCTLISIVVVKYVSEACDLVQAINLSYNDT